MAEKEDPKEELDFYFKLANPLALSLPDAEEKARAAAWLRRLGEEEAGAPRMRADYLRLLVFALQRRRLVGVFAAPPDNSQPLQPFPGGASLSEMMRRLGTQAAAERGAGDRPGVSSMLSHDLKQFLAVQPLPHDRGTHCYMALSPDTYPNWASKAQSQERSRRRSAPGQQQQCPCASDTPPRGPATSTPIRRSPCECRPPPPSPAAARAICGPPAPRACDCPQDQSCWCPQDVATPGPGYDTSSFEVDSDSDPLFFSWMDQSAMDAAAKKAAMRALSDACDESSARLPALWQSEESGFEPMEWDSYHKGNLVPAGGEYRGGRVFTTASRMEVRRSEERLPDGSLLAMEERTAAGAATRVCPPPPGTCPASPPQSTSAAVGATQRRVMWSPPTATSTPCPGTNIIRRRPPCSPQSPISSPCRRSRTSSPPCSMSMTPDSLDASRSRRSSLRSSLRSPRRSYSAESVCPASGTGLDSVTPPSGLRFSGSAGLSLSPCPASRKSSPCPGSRRRSTSPMFIRPGERGISSISPPARVRSPCPSYSGGGLDSVTPPSGLLSSTMRSSAPCSPSPCSPPPCAPSPCKPPPCSPDPYSKIGRPGRFFSPLPARARRSSTPPCAPSPCAPPPSPPSPCAPSPCAPSPCAPSPCAPSPCAPSPCAPPPCSPDPYAKIGRPGRFFSPLPGRARRPSTPPCSPPPCAPSPCAPSPCAPSPCAPSPCPPSPCAPSPCAPSPCSPDPYANIQRPKRFFSPLAALAKSASFEYDEDPFYGLEKSAGSDSCCCAPPPPPSPSPCVDRFRSSAPKSFYRLTDTSPRSTPRRTSSPCAPPSSPQPCPASTKIEQHRTPCGMERRSYSRECPSTSSDHQGGVSAGATSSFAMTSRSPSPEREEWVEMPCQAPLGDWVDPDPMWTNVPCDPDNTIDSTRRDASGDEDPFAFLDRGPNRFNFPPDDPCYSPETSRETSTWPSASPARLSCPASTSRSRSPSPCRSPSSRYSSPPRLRRWGNMGALNTSASSSRYRSSSPRDSCSCDEPEPQPEPCPAASPPACASPRSPCPEGWIQMPLQAPLGEWVDPGPMWADTPTNPDNSIDCSRDVGEGPWAILDQPVPRFSYPPIHPRR